MFEILQWLSRKPKDWLLYLSPLNGWHHLFDLIVNELPQSFSHFFFSGSLHFFCFACIVRWCLTNVSVCQAGDQRRRSKKNILRVFRAEKHTAQVSAAHPHELYLRAQVIIQAAMVCNGWKQRPTVRNTRMSFGWFIYTWASMTFFRHFTVTEENKPSPACREAL